MGFPVTKVLKMERMGEKRRKGEGSCDNLLREGRGRCDNLLIEPLQVCPFLLLILLYVVKDLSISYFCVTFQL